MKHTSPKLKRNTRDWPEYRNNDKKMVTVSNDFFKQQDSLLMPAESSIISADVKSQLLNRRKSHGLSTAVASTPRKRIFEPMKTFT